MTMRYGINNEKSKRGKMTMPVIQAEIKMTYSGSMRAAVFLQPIISYFDKFNILIKTVIIKYKMSA